MESTQDQQQQQQSQQNNQSRIRKIWCHVCKYQFETQDPSVFSCEKCQGDFCEEIIAESNQADDPRVFVPYGEEVSQQPSSSSSSTASRQPQQTRSPTVLQQLPHPNINSFFPPHLQQQLQQQPQMIQQLNPLQYSFSVVTNNGRTATVTSTTNILNNSQNPQQQHHNHIHQQQQQQPAQNPNIFGFNNIFASLFPTLSNQLNRRSNGSLFGNGAFDGSSFENILDFIMRNDTNIHGTPPAATEAINSLPKVTFTKKIAEENEEAAESTQSTTICEECSVCKEEFNEKEELVKMPCNHLFHVECLTTWLKMHNSCPTCRYELPTDNPDYERKRNDQINRNQQQQSQQQQQQQQQDQNRS